MHSKVMFNYLNIFAYIYNIESIYYVYVYYILIYYNTAVRGLTDTYAQFPSAPEKECVYICQIPSKLMPPTQSDTSYIKNNPLSSCTSFSTVHQKQSQFTLSVVICGKIILVRYSYSLFHGGCKSVLHELCYLCANLPNN